MIGFNSYSRVGVPHTLEFNSFDFYAVYGRNLFIPSSRVGAPRLGNPGSATDVPFIFAAITFLLVSLNIQIMWETICDVQAGFYRDSKFVSKFSREPLSGISDQRAHQPPNPHPQRNGKLQILVDQSLNQTAPPPPKPQENENLAFLNSLAKVGPEFVCGD